MREIKFRAWDKNKKHMVYDGDSNWMPTAYPVKVTNLGIKFCTKLTKDTSIKSENGEVGYTDWEYDKFYWEDIELMQYTGLKDKNGKEIYEGDIVRWHKFNDEQFSVKEIKWFTEDGNWIIGRTERMEVIGNIYESPNLLEK